MKRKLVPLLAGITALALAALPVFAQAQTSPSTPQPPPRVENGRRSLFSSLNLSAEQRTRIAQIKREKRAQLESILTAEQRAQLEAQRSQRRSSGQTQPPSRRGPMSNLNLSEEQRSQLRQLAQSTRSQIEAVLTPEQRQQIQQYRQSRRPSRPLPSP